ncbi:glycosyltransferase family 4 protein [Vibrio metschnikovii]|nr:glycosyltransferase family 4 protein [Vibrio metschnikovii]
MLDYVIITHIPVFYKVNLYNELAKVLSIHVIFISDDTDEKRAADFNAISSSNFSYTIINDGGFQNRNVFSSIKKIVSELRCLKFKKLLVGGWDLPEFWISVFLTRKKCNAVVVESTIYESKMDRLKKLFKKIFLSRVSSAFCSGSPHVMLLHSLDFKGKIHVTQGVGVINFSNSVNNIIYEKLKNPVEVPQKFLYVGRLSHEKGLFFAINFFKQHPELSFTIVGDGPLREKLVNAAPINVNLVGAIDNKNLGEIYLSHDVFLLPSYSETWGLVVEEALHFGLPVICSSMVGCSIELVEKPGTGVIYIDSNKESLIKAIDVMIDNYKFYVDNVIGFSIEQKNTEQVSKYFL